MQGRRNPSGHLVVWAGPGSHPGEDRLSIRNAWKCSAHPRLRQPSPAVTLQKRHLCQEGAAPPPRPRCSPNGDAGPSRACDTAQPKAEGRKVPATLQHPPKLPLGFRFPRPQNRGSLLRQGGVSSKTLLQKNASQKKGFFLVGIFSLFPDPL